MTDMNQICPVIWNTAELDAVRICITLLEKENDEKSMIEKCLFVIIKRVCLLKAVKIIL